MTDNLLDHPALAQPEENGLLRIVYVSLSVGEQTEDVVRQIEDRSARRNAASGITGILIAQEPFFYGILEGPERKVLRRMEAIVTDARHRAVRILREEPLSERRFLGWRLFRLPEEPASGPQSTPAVDFVIELANRLRES